jgi:hypothetical protein
VARRAKRVVRMRDGLIVADDRHAEVDAPPPGAASLVVAS